jgi:hypothetical protein
LSHLPPFSYSLTPKPAKIAPTIEEKGGRRRLRKEIASTTEERVRIDDGGKEFASTTEEGIRVDNRGRR